ncbi:RicAFT regulatory complex protein RicA family protein [Lihuaxuella thermophila]|uniref:Cell fate regulator YmcA, YheA/YmcA/DUF963 family (Controls sporulation, competence, biofilm development) n=1 Tax=Lihuaxuella thermophila TaxID=1173111 RepID=A0A1H8GH17_9BACL|nr:YlbF family regulator [Lihuaxuella thermophila]SEN43302.1 Cell fate regulator YmcA, YheA/YmcA/DUF963 family (controls sporulation, competence, biofilm development) [Lihuaxuella thermophila]
MLMIDPDHPVLRLSRKFAERLQSCEEIRRFRLAEEQVNRSKTVQHYIETIKRKQKELVHAKHYQKREYTRLLEQELDRLNHELESLPIVREYQQAQVDVNDLLQTIQQVIADTVSTKINVQTGGDVPSGCGSGGPCGCSRK